MEIYQLRSFIEIARVQNLTRASANLHISQSALSSQIKMLEDELEVLLFSRSPKGMMLTDNGRILLSHAEEVVDASATMAAKAQELSGTMDSTIRVGLNTDGSFLKVRALSRALVSTFPEVNFIFISSATIRTAEMLRQQHIDLGFFFGTSQFPDIYAEELDKATIRIVVPKTFLPKSGELSWEYLATLPWIWSVCECPYYQIVQVEFDQYRLAPRKFIDATEEDVIKELVLDGQGVAILRQDEAEDVCAGGNAVIWDEKSFDVPLSFGCLKNRASQPGIRGVMDLIRTMWDK